MSIDQLINAVKAGDLDGVRRLVEADPSIADTQTPEGIPLVRLAMYYGQSSIADELAEAGAQLDVFSAAALGRLPAVQQALSENPQLLDASSSDGFPPIGLAAFFGQREVAAWLLEQGADPRQIADNAMRVQPLHSAVAGGHFEVARLLLEHGADVNARDNAGETTLMKAAVSGRLRVVRYLLDKGASVDAGTERSGIR